MKLTAWRVVKAAYAPKAFDGQGASLYGGRWNRPGTPVVYLAQSISLALLEIVVHTGSFLHSYVHIPVSFDKSLVKELPSSKLPAGWHTYPVPANVQAIGTAWARRLESPVLRVPSAVVPREFNFLLNPLHPDFSKLVIGTAEPLDIDPRLRGKS